MDGWGLYIAEILQTSRWKSTQCFVYSPDIPMGSSEISGASSKTSRWNLVIADCWAVVSPMLTSLVPPDFFSEHFFCSVLGFELVRNDAFSDGLHKSFLHIISLSSGNPLF